MNPIALIILCIISFSSISDDGNHNKNVLEKYIEITNKRNCDLKYPNSYQCLCKVAIHYPIFTSIKDIIARSKINEVISNFIDEKREKMNKCQVAGEDFGENRIKYDIVFEDDEFLSVAFHVSNCCNENDKINTAINIFNFSKNSGNLSEFKDFFVYENFNKAQSFVDTQLNKATGRLENYKNYILKFHKNNLSRYEAKLKDNAFFYFTSDGLNLKILPDSNEITTFDIQIPNEFLKERNYISKNIPKNIPKDIEQLMNDNQIDPYQGVITSEE